MSMTAPPSSGGNDFEKHPAGPTAIICSRIIDKGSVFNPKDQSTKRKISLVFESAELMTTGDFAGKPFLLFGNFNYSMYQNSLLCKFVEGWNGKRFVDQDDADNYDLSTLLGKPLFANIVHNGDFVNIDSPMPVPKGMAAPSIQGDSYLFSFQAPDVKAWEKISDKMKEKMKAVPEYQEWLDSPIPGPDFETNDIPQAAAPELDAKGKPVMDDDIPF